MLVSSAMEPIADCNPTTIHGTQNSVAMQDPLTHSTEQ